MLNRTCPGCSNRSMRIPLFGNKFNCAHCASVYQLRLKSQSFQWIALFVSSAILAFGYPYFFIVILSALLLTYQFEKWWPLELVKEGKC